MTPNVIVPPELDQRDSGFLQILDGDSDGSFVPDIGAFEFLEGETFIVSNTNDNGPGSLRQAILDANAKEGADRIEFDPELSGQTISLTSGELQITDFLTINGLGADELIISGNQDSRVFLVDDGRDSNQVKVFINGLTITEGDINQGGGINNSEDLTITQSRIVENRRFSADTSYGAIAGAGIFNFSNGTLTLLDSTISGNSGGGILNSGTATLRNSTISGNVSTSFPSRGAGIDNSGILTLTNITVAGYNYTDGGYGGVYNSGIVTVANSIFSGNGDYGDPKDFGSTGTVISQGFNIVSFPSSASDFDAPGDQVGIDPLLGPLQQNGGPTETHALLFGSPAIDAGDPNFEFPPEFDQRGSGFPRVLDGDGDGTAIVDIGAFEFDSEVNIVVGTPDDDFLQGTLNSDQVNGFGGNDSLIGGGNQDRFIIAAGDGTDTISDFGGVGTGVNPSQSVINEVDTLELSGAGLTPENMLITQNGPDLEITFQGVDNTKVILQNFSLEDLDNLTTETSASVDIGNILFDGQTEIEDSFDVFNANQNRRRVFNRNTVTFLNELDNTTSGFHKSDDVINGQGGNDVLSGLSGNDLLRGEAGDDSLTGGGDRDRFAIAAGDGTDTISDFGGVGTGVNPSQSVINEVDTLEFSGSELTPENMLVTQNGPDLEITFEGVDDTKVILQNFSLEDLDNLTSETGAALTIGNILFDGQTSITDSFDVFNANQTRNRVFNRNTVTFLNDLDNVTSGFSNSDDVINGQGGNDTLTGLSGNDLLRGNAGDDRLRGQMGDDSLIGGRGKDSLSAGAGSDFLNGGEGNDTMFGGLGSDTFEFGVNSGVDIITDFSFRKDLLDVSLFFSDIDQVLGTGGAARQVGSATLLEFTESDFVLLLDIDVNELSSANFILS